MKKQHLGKRKLSSFQLIILGFILVILIGSFLLMLPFSTTSGRATPFLEALFTSTSATCVTGLAVHDTATYWSDFGQAVILLLIQIGGMGVVTIAVALAVISGRKIGLFARNTMQEALSAHKMGGVLKLTKFILFSSFMIEALGAIFLSPVFVNATTDGVVLAPSWFAITVGLPPSITATQLFVVPKSIPMIFPILLSS